MKQIELIGLQGNNPFDFLAALGVQVAFEHEVDQPRLWWSSGVIPHAIVSNGFEIDRIANQAHSRLRTWLQGTALSPSHDDGNPIHGGASLKFTLDDTRTYLEHAMLDKFAGRFSMALVAEGSLDNNRKSKPTDLYFTAGNQQFLKIVKEVIEKTTNEEIAKDLGSGLPKELSRGTLMLDVADDAVYAHAASNPSKATKFLKPGIEALAILGLSRIPVYGSRSRTLTQGSSGSWNHAKFEWPMWERPATFRMINAILAATTPHSTARQATLDGWSVTKVYQSVITRASQGGYGTFRPAQIVWSIDESRRKKSKKKRHEVIEILNRARAEARSNGITQEKLAELIKIED